MVEGQVYHVFNRGINKQPVFFTPKNYKRATETVEYYLIQRPPLRYSKFRELPDERRKELIESMKKLKHGVEIIGYVFMHNHFHFILKQVNKDGIKDFIRNFQISYTKYLNTLNKRTGPLFQGQFKAILIEDNEQLHHVVRYIHLNPYTSFVLKDIDELRNYQWSSLQEYLGYANNGFCSKENILSDFPSQNDYWIFVSNHADYQRKLNTIKHLTFD